MLIILLVKMIKWCNGANDNDYADVADGVEARDSCDRFYSGSVSSLYRCVIEALWSNACLATETRFDALRILQKSPFLNTHKPCDSLPAI